MSGYGHQLRFWSGELPRRAKRSLAWHVPPDVNSWLVNALESVNRPRDLTLGTGLSRATEIVRERHVLSSSAVLVCPELPGVLAEDGYWFPPTTVYRLGGVRVDIDSGGLVFSRDWVVNGSGPGQRWSIDTAFITGAARRVRAAARRPESRPVAVLGNADELYHFLMETLPQVLRIREVEPETIFLTSGNVAPFARDRLDELGVRLQQQPRHEVLDCEDHYLCPGYPRERTHPADMHLLATTYAPQAIAGSATARVYVSRAGSARSIHEEERLEAWLRTRGFDIVRLETLPFTEQVACLASAELVVGPHGMGLANTVFMPPGGHVIELASTEWWSNAFRRISQARGHRYTLVPLASTPVARWGSADEAIALLDPLV